MADRIALSGTSFGGAIAADSVSLQKFIRLLSDQRFRAAVLNTLITGTAKIITSSRQHRAAPYSIFARGTGFGHSN